MTASSRADRSGSGAPDPGTVAAPDVSLTDGSDPNPPYAKRGEGDHPQGGGGADSPDAGTGAASSEPYTHKGLTYPLGRRGPETGELIQLAEGLGWARLPVPGSLRHINVWLLDEADGGLTIVDTGLDIPPSREAWEALFAGPLEGRSVTRIVCTHFHPDHLGLAGWLCERFGVRLWMTRDEWLFARMLTADRRDAPPREAVEYWRAAGWEEERIEAEKKKGWGRFSSLVSPVPVSFIRIRDGETLTIGARGWKVVVGNGHCPEHACLVAPGSGSGAGSGGLIIAGDQVLPRITSNVSLSLSEPEADPLGDWLDSIEKLKQLPDTLLVLPSHGEPFTGLHARLDALAAGHRDRLDALHAHIAAGPRRAVDCFSILFGRQIDDSIIGLATGEAMAHLRRLEVEGRAVREVREGVHWYSAT